MAQITIGNSVFTVNDDEVYTVLRLLRRVVIPACEEAVGASETVEGYNTRLTNVEQSGLQLATTVGNMQGTLNFQAGQITQLQDRVGDLEDDVTDLSGKFEQGMVTLRLNRASYDMVTNTFGTPTVLSGIIAPYIKINGIVYLFCNFDANYTWSGSQAVYIDNLPGEITGECLNIRCGDASFALNSIGTFNSWSSDKIVLMSKDTSDKSGGNVRVGTSLQCHGTLSAIYKEV